MVMGHMLLCETHGRRLRDDDSSVCHERLDNHDYSRNKYPRERNQGSGRFSITRDPKAKNDLFWSCEEETAGINYPMTHIYNSNHQTVY